ncbi:MAG: hypothetical protein M0Z34_08750 [Nitrospiraceae bacterium]|nr:hypothetical protein [Nitrospiraceae bacterium]
MKLALAVILPLFASLVNLNSPGHYVNIGVISISVANLLVIILMVLVFVLAVALPFPHKKEHGA